MANFKVGQRVRRIAVVARAVPVGVEGTVVRGNYVNHLGEFCDVRWDNGAPPTGYYTYTLAPLTPPKEEADTWAADKVKQVTKPQHMEPVVAERLREFDRNFTD